MRKKVKTRKNPTKAQFSTPINTFKVILDVNVLGKTREEAYDKLIDFLEFELEKVSPFTAYSARILE